MADRTPYCLHCGRVCPKTLEQTWTDWEAMRFCDDTCERAHRLPRDELIEELELLLGTDHLNSIARRLGYRPDSLARRLQRCGRPDLARHFNRLEITT
jgi:hypothetical protein